MFRRTTVVLATLAIAGTVATRPGSVGASTPHASRLSHHHHLLVTRLKGVHNATQVIAVTTARYGSVHATVQAFAKTSSGWRRVAGPWSAWIARNGFAKPGHKREGDGKVPSGSYHFAYMFGDEPNPGVHYRWRHASSHDYWDDDSTTNRYNRWVNARKHDTGRAPEPLYAPPSYNYVGVINYNARQTPYRGSAIFLHVTHHSPTSGCVALPQTEVVRLLRWLDPKDHARIIMGRTATVTR